MRRPNFYLRKKLGNMPVVIGDRILDAIDNAPDGFYFTDYKDFVIAPPAEEFFVEYKTKFHDSEESLIICTHISVFSADIDNPIVQSTLSKVSNDLNHPVDDFLCLLILTIFYTDKAREKMVYGLGTFSIALDKRGYVIRGQNNECMWFNEETDENTREIYANEMHIILYILSLLSCRSQIELAPAPFSRQQRRQMERNGEDPTVYKVLKVKAGKKYPALERLLSGQAPIADKRLHLVRGHFKHYDNLFGKYEGVFYWEPHYRGNEAVGKVDKDYEVEIPDNLK